MKKMIATFAAAAILGGSFAISLPAASAHAADTCYSTSTVHESRYKRVVAGEKETSTTEYRFRSRTTLYGSKEIKSIDGWDFVDGGTTKVNGQVVAGHWVKSSGFHQIPDVIINIVWGKGGVPEQYLGTGTVSLSAYGGPSQTVKYQAEKVVTDAGYTDWGPWSDWSTTNPGDDAETREVDSREVGNGDGKPDQTVYYLPGGDTSSTLGEANWTTETPSDEWTLIDQRDRDAKTKVECPPEPEETTPPEPKETTPPTPTPTTKPKPTPTKRAVPAPKKVTMKVQVDKYSTRTSKLRSKAVRYDDDGLLRKGEDRSHYGHSTWEIVTVKGTTETTKSEWLRKINKATKRVPDLTSSNKWTVSAAKGHKSITVAWIIRGDGKPTAWYYKHIKTKVAQRYFATNR